MYIQVIIDTTHIQTSFRRSPAASVLPTRSDPAKSTRLSLPIHSIHVK